jgi:multicomponent Na+:H+ antiporter subunit G
MHAISAIATSILVISGALIALIAALGILRLPDLFSRMHSAAKAGTAGSGLILIGVALHSGELVIWVKCLAVIGFFLLTAPVSAHLLAKAALQAGYKPAFLDQSKDETPS